MNLKSLRKCSLLLGLSFFGFFAVTDGFAAATRTWTNSLGGFWGLGTNNWSPAGAAPSSGDTALITNAVSKTIIIDTNTLAANLATRNLTLSAPAGATNTLLIQGSAAPQVFKTDSNGTLAINSGGNLTASNAALTVAGTWTMNNSVLNVSNSVVTATGNGNFTLNSNSAAIINYSTLTNATVNLNQGTTWNATNSTFRLLSGESFNNNGGAVIFEGGTMDTSAFNTMRIGRYATNSGSLTVYSGTVTGTTMQVGVDRGQGTVNLSNGLVALTSWMQVGFSGNGSPINGGTGLVNVAGGELRVTNDAVNVGSRGPGRLNVSGGSANFAVLSVGEVAGVQGTVSVSAGQLVTVPGTIIVSPFTNICRIGNQGSGELDVSGGVATVMTELSIADNLGSTGIVAVTGGQLLSTSALSSIGKYGFGQLTVSHGVAVFTNTSVGRHEGGEGVLVVEGDGSFFALDALSIGRFTNSLGHVFVNGGLLSLTNDALWVGREGTGDLTVSNGIVRAAELFVGRSEDGTNTPFGTAVFAGGAMLLSSNFVVGASLLDTNGIPVVSTGMVSVVGGTLAITNNALPTTFNMVQGSFTLGGGDVIADNIFLTNAGGQFVFNGGTLWAKNLTVSNGLPFTVGDGVNPAMFHLEGGTYSFADGLVIAANATVTGCGTIIGPIVNNGTYNNSCGANTPPVLTLPANQIVTELVALNLAATATDSDIPTNPLTFALVSGPTNLSVSAAGVIDWTPSEAQGPSTNSVTIKVTDYNPVATTNAQLSVTNSFQIIVKEWNSPPSLTVPLDTNIFTSAAYTATATATDTDIPANLLTFSLISPPANMTINPTNGTISWTPSEAQSASTNIIFVSVTDTNPSAVNAKQLSVTNSYIITVTKLCGLAITAPPSGRAAVPGATVIFTVTAATPAAQTNFQWQLNATNLIGQTKDTLTITNLQNSGFGTYRVLVNDGICSETSAPAILKLAVSPAFYGFRVSGTTMIVDFPTEPGPTYIIETKTHLNDPAWTVVSTYNGDGAPKTFTRPTQPTPQSFFRIRLQ